jgi:hypothetical protein
VVTKKGRARLQPGPHNLLPHSKPDPVVGAIKPRCSRLSIRCDVDKFKFGIIRPLFLSNPEIASSLGRRLTLRSQIALRRQRPIAAHPGMQPFYHGNRPPRSHRCHSRLTEESP